MKKRIQKIVLIILFLFFLTSPFLYFFLNLLFGFWGLKQLEIGFEKGDFLRIKNNVSRVQESFARAGNFFVAIDPLFKFFGFANKTERLEKIFSVITVSTEIANQSFLIFEKGDKVFENLLAEKKQDANINEVVSDVNAQLKIVLQKTATLQILLIDFSGTEPIYGSYFERLKTSLPKIQKMLTQSRQLATILPEVLGLDGRRTYLVLLQNNMELRPTGGFIGSYGIVTLEKGKLVDFEIQDVYFADGQLKGHVEAPPKVQQFLGASGGWYLRDSNWDPDFPTSAAKAGWFLEKETGRRVDGVIGVNLFAAQRLLEILGPIDVSDYGEKITADNFFERSQFHNEVGFFPGSREKRNFLTGVANALFEKVKRADKKEVYLLGQSILRSLEGKDILIAFNDEGVMKKIRSSNWDGGLKMVKCETGKGGCFEDYLMIAEANVGVNKVNYFVQRSLSLKTEIAPTGQLEKKLLISYENKSPSSIFPGGVYKNYLRLYVPQGSVFESCFINNTECGNDETEEHGRKVFGILAEVPPGEKRQLEINWQLESRFNGGEYLFLFQKQSGSKNDSLQLSFAYPSNWKVFSKTPASLTGIGKLVYNTKLSTDKVFELDFSRSGN